MTQAATFRPRAKVLVTGATGHVGANVVHRLLAEGIALRCLVVPSDDARALAGLDVEVVKGDVRDAAAVDDAMRGCSHVFHVAAKLSTHTATRAEEREIWDVNVLGTKHVLKSAAKHGVDRLVFTGSFSSVGFDPDEPTRASNEEAPFYPFFPWLPYARTKVLAELEVMKATVRGLDCVIAKSCACIGPWDYVPSRLGQVLCDYANGKLRAYIPGGFDFVASTDLAEGHLLAMTRGRTGEKYVFSSEFLTLEQLLALYAEASGRTLRLARLPAPVMNAIATLYYGVAARAFPRLPQRLTPGAIAILRMHRRADIQKARDELGYRPTSVRDAVFAAHDFFVREGMIRAAARTHASKGAAAVPTTTTTHEVQP